MFQQFQQSLLSRHYLENTFEIIINKRKNGRSLAKRKKAFCNIQISKIQLYAK